MKLLSSEHGTYKTPSSAVCPPQAELEALVKQEHAQIDSKDKKEQPGEAGGAAAKASSSSVKPEE